MTVANCITLLRLILVPFVVYYFLIGEYGTAFVLFCVAGASDLIDGTVARLLKQRSNWGAVLDPIADKLLLESAFICLVVAGVLPLWFFLLALARDLMIVVGIAYLKIRKIDFPHRAIWASKFATFAQMLTIILGLVVIWRPAASIAGVAMATFMRGSMFCAVALIVLSGALYVRLGLSILEKNRGR